MTTIDRFIHPTHHHGERSMGTKAKTPVSKPSSRQKPLKPGSRTRAAKATPLPLPEARSEEIPSKVLGSLLSFVKKVRKSLGE